MQSVKPRFRELDGDYASHCGPRSTGFAFSRLCEGAGHFKSHYCGRRAIFDIEFAENVFDVLADGAGLCAEKLGTTSSSRRFKKDIKSMDQTSEAILALKPVTFHYKGGDTKKAQERPQYGLITEDVAAVNPDLIVRDKDGAIYSVRYDAVNVMLLNEFLKGHKKVEEQQSNITQLNSKLASQAAIIAEQQKGMEVLTAQLKEQAAQIQKVSAQLQLNDSAPRTVASDH